jgi:pyridoxal phosphate enzyme (YggS family)
MNNIASRLFDIKALITAHAREADRSPSDIQLLAVSKTKPVEAIYAAYHAGQRLFGESYVQEAVQKIQLLQASPDYADIEWHFIGPLQSNKTKLVAEHFDWVHSVDREKIAQRLNEQRPTQLPALNICLQVNISGEQTKSGINADEVFGLAGIISDLPHLKLRGLMAIAENTDDINIVRDNFLQMRQLFNDLKSQYPSVDTLSMGMTDDMSQAIHCGSTMVRIGTAIFGSREYK